MKSFKQALIAMKNLWRETLALGFFVTGLLFVVRVLPFISMFALSIALILIQRAVTTRLANGNWPKNFSFLKSKWPAYIIVGIILMPTSILVGSAFGLLQTPQELWMTLPLTCGLFFLGIYFYIILNQAIELHLNSTQTLAKSIDVVALTSFRFLKKYALASFYLGAIFALSSLVRGAGFVLALPALFFVTYYLDQEIKATKTP